MTTREIDKCIGKLIQVSWPDTGQTGSMRITIRRPRSSVVETEAGQVFEAKLMKLEAIFRGIE